MGMTIVEKVVQLLNDGGVPANFAQPEGKMVNVLIPVAAVSIQSVDQAQRKATVRVEIVGMADEGGHRCEQRAMQAYDLLRAAGGICQVQRCTFSGRAGLFSVPVLASFSGDASEESWEAALEPEVHSFSAVVAGKDLLHLTQFESVQAVGDADTQELEDMPWQFTLEEQVPAGEMGSEAPTGIFKMSVTTDVIRENYEGCYLTSLRREVGKTGTHQVWKGIATLRTVETIV